MPRCSTLLRWFPSTDRHQRLSLEDNYVWTSPADPYAYMSNAVGVGSHALTADGHLVLVRRAGPRACAEWAGATDRPGGHPEPDSALNAMKKWLGWVLLSLS